MNTLIIQHMPGSEPPQFQLMAPDGKVAPPRVVPSPVGFPVEDCPQGHLMTELQWYLEKFLDYPFSPNVERADRVLAALESWGVEAFASLFGDGLGGQMFKKAVGGGYDRLYLQILSFEPQILSWPWEALREPESVPIVQTCQIERLIKPILQPIPISDLLPRDRVNILLVTARPTENDVNYRSISRLLVDLIHDQRLPAEVHVLRPPTFDRLKEHLRERPNYYHILHFDGHGAYGERFGPDHESAHTLRRGPQGHLIFEDAEGKAKPVTGEQLSAILREFQLPVVVLNACQSGMIDSQAHDPFASVAASLLQSGVRSVVAMAYSLYVTGAQIFLPAFYRRLFDCGNISQAIREGRQQMWLEPERVCSRGRYPLQDWLNPVLYQQELFDFSFARETRVPPTPTYTCLPKSGTDRYGFIGRDGPLLKMERARRGKQPAILVHGLGGVGKTTLARGFIEWLEKTQGMEDGCFWFAFNEIHSAEYIFNRMGESFWGSEFAVQPMEDKIIRLTETFHDSAHIIVWDNFESVHGRQTGDLSHPGLSREDKACLQEFLSRLRGGKTKVIITSRGEEDWLRSYIRKNNLTGFNRDERWNYLELLLEETDFKVNYEDPDLTRLVNQLQGHPLSMRSIIPMLEESSPAQILDALKHNLGALNLTGDTADDQLMACLRYVHERLPGRFRPLLIPLALHENYVAADFLTAMAESVNDIWTSDTVEAFLATLANNGLLSSVGNNTYEIHPVLSGYLRQKMYYGIRQSIKDEWGRAFVITMSFLADNMLPREPNEQRNIFGIFGPTIQVAALEAERLKIEPSYRVLIECQAKYALNTNNLWWAEKIYKNLAGISHKTGGSRLEAVAYYQLAVIAEKQGDYDRATYCCKKSLEIEQRLGNEHGVALSYYELGRIAQEQGLYDKAEIMYEKCREVSERSGNKKAAASAYHQLGRIAEERGDYDRATYWCEKSLELKEQLGNKWKVASGYHQLGVIATAQGELEKARIHCEKSLEIKKQLGDESGMVTSYHQLATIAESRGAHDQAATLFEKSLEISERLGNEQQAGMTYGALGFSAGRQGRYEEAVAWFKKAARVFLKRNDARKMQYVTLSLHYFYSEAKATDQEKIRQQWQAADLPEIPWDAKSLEDLEL